LSPFAQRCGVHDAPREAACAQLLQQLQAQGVEQVRIGWCDLHGLLRGKTLMLPALPSALRDGLGMVSTLLLKDSSDRTVLVFEPRAGRPARLRHAVRLLLPTPQPATCPGAGTAGRPAG
jgi:glutamine synthetase